LHGNIRSVNSISEFRIPGIGGVKEATHDKNAETTKCEMSEYVDPTPFQSFRYREIEKSRVENLQHRSPRVVKSRIPKAGDSSGYRELKCQNTAPKESQNHEMQNVEISKAGDGFGYREMEESCVETPHHRSPEVAKCENLKS
jgi:hypothetical protein